MRALLENIRLPIWPPALAGWLLLAMPVVAEPAAGGACAKLELGPQRTVTRIIDGETVGLDDGSELRLIGALAPRAADAGAEPGLWPMEIAVQEELRALLLGKSIELAFGGERTDRYGRAQAHAFMVDGDRRRWVQGHVLEQGLARAYTLAGNRGCADELLAAERSAREAHRGLWAEGAYRVRPAHQASELSRYRATFQLVEGRIARVAPVRGTIYLNFDADWRRAFSVSLRRSDRSLLGAYADDPKGLEGKLVRVRGWIEQHAAAPAIDLSAAGQLEVLDQGDAGVATRSKSRRRSRGPEPPDSQAPRREAKPPGLVETGR